MSLSKTQLLNHLEQFIGTEFYYPLWPNVMLTDGTRFLADTAGCYWLMDTITSHIQRLPNNEVFTSCRLAVNNGSATLIIDDGNQNVLATQKIPCTGFPLDSIYLYACFDGKQWIIMLPSEY